MRFQTLRSPHCPIPFSRQSTLCTLDAIPLANLANNPGRLTANHGPTWHNHTRRDNRTIKHDREIFYDSHTSNCSPGSNMNMVP